VCVCVCVCACVCDYVCSHMFFQRDGACYALTSVCMCVCVCALLAHTHMRSQTKEQEPGNMNRSIQQKLIKKQTNRQFVGINLKTLLSLHKNRAC